MKLNAPYLIFIGEEEDSTYAKTGQGIVQWRPELVAGQLRFPGCQVDMGVPDMTVDEAVSQGVRSLILVWHRSEASFRIIGGTSLRMRPIKGLIL